MKTAILQATLSRLPAVRKATAGGGLQEYLPFRLGWIPLARSRHTTTSPAPPQRQSSDTLITPPNTIQAGIPPQTGVHKRQTMPTSSRPPTMAGLAL